MRPPPALLVAAGLLLIGVAVTVAVSASDATAAGGLASISAGSDRFTCAVSTDAGVKCWGNNAYGQLGNGTTTQSSAPVDVTGLASNVAAVDSGDQHACARTTAGGVKCWGRNDDGQLGNGMTVGSSTPVDVMSLTSGVSDVSAGYHYACAVTAMGGVKCWGGNSFGHLGNGQFTSSSTPVDVTGLSSGVASVSAGYNSTCALTTTGGVKCWGVYSLTPATVSGLSTGVVAVSAGYSHVCALTAAGGVKCWGNNSDGQLGNGTTQASATPVDVVGLSSGVVSVSAGLDYTCAVTAAGGVKCWGTNTSSKLGSNGPPSSVPIDVAGLTAGAAKVSAGRYHTCAATTSGGAKCWGDNDAGQLGDGTTTDSGAPVTVAKFTPAPTPTSTPPSTPLPPKDPDADTDGDTLPNSADADDDNDGCPDTSELQSATGSEISGGRRNPHDPFDYMNPTHDGVNRIDDVLMVIGQYFDDDGDATPGSPPYQPGYSPATDRTAAGPLPWNLGPPNGLQRLDDVLAVIKQYFHDCS